MERLKREHDFVLAMWRLIKKHRVFTEATWDEGDALLVHFSDVEYAPEMLKSYIDYLSKNKLQKEETE